MFGRRYIELVSGKFVDVLLNLRHSICKHLGCLGESIRVEQHSVHLHFGKHGNKRHFDIVEQILDIGFLESWFQYIIQTQRDVGILGCIIADVGRGDVAHVLLRFTLRSDEFVDVYGLIVEQCFGKYVHVVFLLRLQYIVGKHGVEHRSGESHTVVHQHLHVVLDVLSYF